MDRYLSVIILCLDMSVPLSLGQVGVLEAALSQHSRSFMSVYNTYNTINFTESTVFRRSRTRPLNKYIYLFEDFISSIHHSNNRKEKFYKT